MLVRLSFFIAIIISITNSTFAKDSLGIEQMKKSVVMIQSATQAPDFTAPWKMRPFRQGIGSGFIIDNERILTNAHNVADAKYIIVKKQSGAQKYLARVEFIANDCDLATLKIVEPAGFFDGTLSLEIGELPKLHTSVTTYGFPMGGSQLSVTQGVVSRIQLDRYSHTGADIHLVIQTDAAINPGNSGGPVMQNAKVVGIAFQGLTAADNIGYMIPTTVIKHFLTDIADGNYDGYGNLGLTSYPGLHSKSYANYLKLPEDAQGIVVISTIVGSSVADKFKKNDCITKINGWAIDNDGKIMIHGLRLDYAEAIEAHQIGDKIDFEFYRDGKPLNTSITLANDRPIINYSKIYDIKPDYYTYGGFVFVKLSRDFLESWGNKWIKDIPSYLKFLFYHSSEINKNAQLKEYVVISKILPDEVNSYSESFRNKVVKSVNNEPVNSLRDLASLIENNKDDYIEIKFRGNNETMIIDSKLAKAHNAAILKKYNVTSESSLGN